MTLLEIPERCGASIGFDRAGWVMVLADGDKTHVELTLSKRQAWALLQDLRKGFMDLKEEQND